MFVEDLSHVGVIAEGRRNSESSLTMSILHMHVPICPISVRMRIRALQSGLTL